MTETNLTFTATLSYCLYSLQHGHLLYLYLPYHALQQFLEPYDNLSHCDLLQLPLAHSDSYKTINLTLIISWLTTYYRSLRKLCTLSGTLNPTSLWRKRFTYSIIPVVTLSLLEISHFAGFFLYSWYLMIIKHISRCISINLTGTSFNTSALNS